MKTIIAAMLILASTNCFSAKCTQESLIGQYSYELSGTAEWGGKEQLAVDGRYSMSTHEIGVIRFDGKGGGTFAGNMLEYGQFIAESGTISYAVSADCTVSGTLYWDGNNETRLVMVLDTLNTKSIAYHAVYGITNNQKFSASGSITKKERL